MTSDNVGAGIVFGICAAAAAPIVGPVAFGTFAGYTAMNVTCCFLAGFAVGCSDDGNSPIRPPNTDRLDAGVAREQELHENNQRFIHNNNIQQNNKNYQNM